MAEWYEVCVYCGKPIDFSRAAIVVGDDPAPASYQPFMEDWRGGFVKVAHTRCFADAQGVDALLDAVERNDVRQREARR